jgi:SOS-response transcriptional repressor LexA
MLTNHTKMYKSLNSDVQSDGKASTENDVVDKSDAVIDGKASKKSDAIDKSDAVIDGKASKKSDAIDKSGAIKGKRIPFYDISAIAGNEFVADMSGVTRAEHTIDVGDLLPGSQCAIRIHGDSMSPGFPSGCIIALRAVDDGIVEFGSAYVVETRGNLYFKRLYKDTDKVGYVCYSDNTAVFTEGARAGMPRYEPFVIGFDKIKRLFRVIGMVAMSSNSFVY